jgi:hypothetical protein
MKALVQRLSLPAGAAMVAVFILSMSQCSCGLFSPRGAKKRPYCSGGTDNITIHVDRKAKKGVQEETVVACPGDLLHWTDVNGEGWHLDLKDPSTSPFVTNEVKLKKGDKDPGGLIAVGSNSVAFPYSITVDNTAYDPQIVIMGK